MEWQRETEQAAEEKIPATSKTLYNFSMSTWLKWGNQKHLRCIKSESPETTKKGLELKKDPEAETAMEEDEEEGEGSGSAKPWNLRTRRAEGQSGKFSIKSPPRPQQNESSKPSRLRNSSSCNGEREMGKERPKFSLTLTKKEIEEDFLKMTGEKPPRRSKKRTNVVQKQLDVTFPGVWMREVTPDMYKVSELPDGRAKRQ